MPDEKINHEEKINEEWRLNGINQILATRKATAREIANLRNSKDIKPAEWEKEIQELRDAQKEFEDGINQHRAQNGLPPVTEEVLTAARPKHDEASEKLNSKGISNKGAPEKNTSPLDFGPAAIEGLLNSTTKNAVDIAIRIFINDNQPIFKFLAPQYKRGMALSLSGSSANSLIAGFHQKIKASKNLITAIRTTTSPIPQTTREKEIGRLNTSIINTLAEIHNTNLGFQAGQRLLTSAALRKQPVTAKNILTVFLNDVEARRLKGTNNNTYYPIGLSGLPVPGEATKAQMASSSHNSNAGWSLSRVDWIGIVEGIGLGGLAAAAKSLIPKFGR